MKKLWLIASAIAYLAIWYSHFSLPSFSQDFIEEMPALTEELPSADTPANKSSISVLYVIETLIESFLVAFLIVEFGQMIVRKKHFLIAVFYQSNNFKSIPHPS